MDDENNATTAVLARHLPLAFVAAVDAAAAAAASAAVVQPAPARGGRASLHLLVGQQQQLLGTAPVSFPAAVVAAAAQGETATNSPPPASNKKRRRGGGGGASSGGAAGPSSQAELAAARHPCHPLARALHGLLLAGDARVEVEEEQYCSPLEVESFADGSALVVASCRVRVLSAAFWRDPEAAPPAAATEAWAAGEDGACARDRAAYALNPRADHVNALVVTLAGLRGRLLQGRQRQEAPPAAPPLPLLPLLAELDDPRAAAGPFAAPPSSSLREEVLSMARQPRWQEQQGPGRQDGDGDDGHRHRHPVWRRSLGPGRPRGLACALYAYQRRCVAWMAWREQGGFRQGSAGGGAGGLSSSSSLPPASSSPGPLGLGLLNPLWRAVLLPAFWEDARGEGTTTTPEAVRRAAERQERGGGDNGPPKRPAVLLYHCAAFGLLSLRRPPALASALGGCLCDEVGVGKTVEVIALALLRPPPPLVALPPPAAEDEDTPQQPPPPLFGGTLVVCPPALLSQWHAEVRRHAPSLRVAVYEGLAYYRQQRELEQERAAARRGAGVGAGGGGGRGASSAPQRPPPAPPPQPPPPHIAFPRGTSQAERRRAREAMAQWSYAVQGPPEAPRYDAEQEAREAGERVSLLHADVVLTAFPVLSREADLDASAAAQRGGALRRAKRYAVPDSPLVAVRWWRVVVDEAQMVPNSPTAAVARVCERLRAPHRWCVTGTPVTDAGAADVHAMLRVLRVAPVGVAVAAAADGGGDAATTTNDPHLAEAVFEAAIARPYREWAAAAAAGRDGTDNADVNAGGDGRRRLAALLRPLAWRHTRADANADHPLPPRSFAVARLRLSAAERSVYDHILARTVAASEAWQEQLQRQRQRETAAEEEQEDDEAAAAAAGPSSPPSLPSPQQRKRARAGCGGRASSNKPSSATAVVQRSLDLAAGELLQLRLACIHPQLTLYWRQLSAEVQGLGGGAGEGQAGEEGGGEGEGGAAPPSSSVVSIGQILRRLRDGAQLRLQAKERELCAALNALAARMTRRAEEEEEVEAKAAAAGGDMGRKGKGARLLPAAATSTSPHLRAEALAVLQQSYAVGEHGTAALGRQAKDGHPDDDDDDANEPLGDIAGAEATWRAWQYQQLHTLGALARAHEHAAARAAAAAAAAAEADCNANTNTNTDDANTAAASRRAAAEARRSAERVTKGLIEPAAAARDRAAAAAASLRAGAEASERELRGAWRDAVRGGGDAAAALLRGGVPAADLLDAAVAEAVAAAEKAQNDGDQEEQLGGPSSSAPPPETAPTPTSSSLELRRRCAEAAQRARAAAAEASTAAAAGSADAWLAFCSAALEAARLAEEADRREQREREQRRLRRAAAGNASSSAAALALASSLSGTGGGSTTTTATVVLLGRRVREVAERLEAAANPARHALEGEQARRQARTALAALAASKRGFDAVIGGGGGDLGEATTTPLMPYDCPPERALLMRALFQHAAFSVIVGGGGGGGDSDAAAATTAANCERDGRACALAARLAPDGLAAAEALRRTLQQASRALQRRLPQWEAGGRPAQGLPQKAVDAGAHAAKLRAKLPRRRYDSYRADLAAEAAEDALSAAAAAASAAFEGNGEAAAAAAAAAAVEAAEDEGGGVGGGGGRGVAGAAAKRKRLAADAKASSSSATNKTEAELRAHADALAARCRELLSQRRFLRNQVLSAERQAAAVERAAAEARAAERRRREAALRAAEARQQVAAVAVAVAEAEAGADAATTTEAHTENDADDECPVCRSSAREQSGEVFVFACGHFCCVACAETLLSAGGGGGGGGGGGDNNNNNSSCAVCRQPISRGTSFRAAMRRTARLPDGGAGAGAAAAAANAGTAAAVAAAEAAAEAAEAAAAEAEAEAAAALLRADPAALAAEAGDPDAEGYVSGSGSSGSGEGEEEEERGGHGHGDGNDANDNDNANANDDDDDPSGPLRKAKSLLRVRVRGTPTFLSKVCALVRRLVWLRDHKPGVKSLVFSQFPDALLIVSRALAANGVRHACIGVGGGGGAPGGGGASGGGGRGRRGRSAGGRGRRSAAATAATGAAAAAAAAAPQPPTNPPPLPPTTTPASAGGGDDDAAAAGGGAGAVGRAARLAVRSFAEDDGVRVMLLSLRAGGQGLTLTRASRVFLLEPSPDPSVDEQAVARVYRIGQERRVVVTRLLVEGTVEEGVAALCGRKGGVGYEGDHAPAAATRHEHLDAADVEGLLRAAAAGGAAAARAE